MKRSKDSFTLIEMLIVVSIIAILAGMSFKLVQISKRNADRANTIAKLEKVAHALNEFKAEYGMYPPVEAGACEQHSGCRICFQYEDTNNQHDAIMALNDDPNAGNLFDMGLVSYLVERNRDGIIHTENKDWVGDTEREELAKARWSVFMEGVVSSPSPVTNTLTGAAGGASAAGYNNQYITIRDAWDQIIKYECDPPYLSYKLWSKGPDKADGTDDDIHKDGWDN